MLIEAKVIGLLARDALALASSADVLARFERSFCLEIGGTLITVGDGGLHDGPLNVRLAGLRVPGLTSALAVERGERWTVSAAGLWRADGLAIDLTRAVVWQPEKPVSRPDRTTSSKGLRHVRQLLLERSLPEGGLIRPALGISPPRTMTERAAQPHIEALRADLPAWLGGDDADPSPAAQLLGLGPGLTPSGDDLLAGLMIAWHYIGASAASRRLGSILSAAGAARTTPISRAHLGAAARGYGAAPLHRLLHALSADDHSAIAEALDGTSKIGHSSGLDAIAGIMLALTAWLDVPCEASIAA